MEVKTFKNGKVILKDQGVEVVADPKEYPKVHVWDKINRYAFITFQGIALGNRIETTVKQREQVAKNTLNYYTTFRGTRTSWTKDDAWLRKWKAALRLEKGA